MESLNNLFQALVVTLREGIEAALVVGIIMAYLARAGRPELKKPVWAAVAAAIAGSVAVAIAFQTIGIDPENEFREGIMYFTAGIMVGTMVIWMWKQGKKAKADIEEKLGSIVSQKKKGLLGSGIGLFVFVFFMIFREGIETVMFMLVLGDDVSASPAYNLIGGSLGIALAAGFGFLLFKGSLRINLRTFFSVTSVVLLIMALKLIAGGIHEWTEVEILPATDAWMNIIGWIAKESTSTIVLMALIGLPALFIFWESRKIKPVLDGSESTADRRKQLAAASSAHTWGMAVGGLGLAIMLALGGTQAAVAASRHDPKPEPVEVQADRAVVPMADLEDGEMHKYTYTSSEGSIRFDIIKYEDEYMAVFDTCEICPAKGFLQEGEDTVVCKNCNAPIDISTLPDGGGCNPMVLESSVDGDNVVIELDDMMDPEVMAKMHGHV
ncbi:MAG: Fe-S-containing protein [Thermoleophilia bacterium]